MTSWKFLYTLLIDTLFKVLCSEYSSNEMMIKVYSPVTHTHTPEYPE